MARIRTAVVGLGYFGTFHANHYARHPEAEFVAIADPRPEVAAQAAGYGVEHIADYRALIGRVDAVSITAPTALHQAIAGDFIAAGVHVLVEKPLCATRAGAAELSAAAERAAVVLNVGHIERFSPTYRALRSRAETPVLIECRRHASWKARATDVDVVLDLMIHDLDLVLDLARSEVATVAASGVAMMGRGLDAVAARIGFANGTVAEVSASRVSPLPGRTILVHEPRRALAADLTARTLSIFNADAGEAIAIDVPPGDALALEISAFLTAARGGERAGVSGMAAVAALDLAERVRHEARG